MRFWAGIGSRSTPQDIALRQFNVSIKLANLGYILRSGGAAGSDTNFELGCDKVGGKKQIFLPIKGFNNHSSDLFVADWPHEEEARKIAEFFHPAWDQCTPFAKNCHTRNVAQILGWNLDKPVEFVFCYTTNGKKKGGTAQAMRIAEHHNIPIFNMFYPDVENIIKFLD